MKQLLLIHGFRGNHLGLKEVAKYLRRNGFEVYVPDLPPASRYPLEKYDAPHYAKWVADYILNKKLDHPVLIGHSMGSIIAAATAEKYPELINEKIVFLAPISVKVSRAIAALTPTVVLLPNKLVGYLTTKYLLIKKDKQSLRAILDLTYRCAAKYTSRLDVAKAAAFSAKHFIRDFSFQKDALFLAGETDRLNSQKATTQTAKHFAGTAKFLKDSGHLLNYEIPETVASEITSFLGSN